MVRKMPVTICSTRISIASEPKMYQKLKFFGAQYLPHWSFQSLDSGKRASTQFRALAEAGASAGSFFSTKAIMRHLSHRDRSGSWYRTGTYDGERRGWSAPACS